jgi:hypothetical protein
MHGETELAVTPLAANSLATVFVRAMTPPFVMPRAGEVSANAFL